MAQEFIDDVTAMSNGEIEIEMFFASSVVKSAETFDAAATGILDCDMTGGSYQTGKTQRSSSQATLQVAIKTLISNMHGSCMAAVMISSISFITHIIWSLSAGGSQAQSPCLPQSHLQALRTLKAGNSVHLQV